MELTLFFIIFHFFRLPQNDYKGMARIIDDTTFSKLIVMLSKDEKVQLFNTLCTAPKTDGKDKDRGAVSSEKSEKSED